MEERYERAGEREARGAARAVVAVVAVLTAVAGCTYGSDTPDIAGRDIRLTILHTSDIHSRILPYDHQPMYTEQKLGLVPDRGPYGGIARIAHIVKRERSRAGRSLYLDSGDVFQGAPIFNRFGGEPEIRALGHAGVDAFALGNHEFDEGPENVVRQFGRWAAFPVLAANYRFVEESQPFARDFADIVEPHAVFNLDGLRVGVIGMGNLSSMTGLEDGGNSKGIIPLDTIQTVQSEIDLLRDNVDVIVLLSHLGLSEDEYVARNACGLDVIMGGHHHVALDPPKTISYDPDAEFGVSLHKEGDYEPDEEPASEVPGAVWCPVEDRREVILSHPHAFSKFVARLDLVVRDGRVRSHRYELFPVDRNVPEDPDVAYVLEDYVRELERSYDLDRVIAHAEETLERFGASGGDSMLGNLVAEAMQYREYVETDFAVTNSLGIRTDIQAGPITLETMFNVLPFENTIATMYLSGVEVREVLDYATARGAGRGCATQIQVSNVTFTMNCRTGQAEDIEIAGQPLEDDAIYEMATNDYMAWGGSGFKMLERNTTKRDTGISMRDAVIDYMREHPALPECFEAEGSGACASGVAVEDGRIGTAY